MSDALALGLAVAKPRITTLQPSIPPVLQSAIGWYDAQDESTVEANGALSFVAANEQYVGIDQAPPFAFPISVSCWFKTSTAGNETFLSIANLATDVDYLRLRINAGRVVADTRNNVDNLSLQTVSTNYGDNQWHLATLSITSASTAFLYVDSVEAISGTAAILSGINHVSIGRLARLTPTAYYTGDVAQTATCITALSEANHLAIYNGGVMVPFDDILTPQNHWWLNDPAPPYVDSAGTLDLGAFGTTGTPTPTKGPNATPAVASSSVSRWLSRSVNANDATQDIRTQQASYLQVPWADGFRWALRSDGVDDLMEAANPSSLPQPFEVMALVRWATPSSGVAECFVGGTTGAVPFSGRTATGGNFQHHMGSTATVGSRITGATYSIVNTEFNSTSARTLVNETLQVDGGSGSTALSTPIYRLFTQWTGGGFLNGEILQFALFDALLSPSDKQAIVGNWRSSYLLHWGDPADSNSYQGPVAWWSPESIGNKPNDDGSGNDVTNGQSVKFLVDVSGTGINATESTAAPTFTAQDTAFGRPSLAYNSTDQRLRNLSFPAITNATIISVIRMDSQSDQQAFVDISQGQVLNSGINLFYTSNTLTFRVRDAVGNKNASAALSTGAHVLVATYDGATMNLYIDSDTVAATETAGALANTLDTATIGNLASASTAWALDGAIAELIIFGRALTTVEINNVAGNAASRSSLSWGTT